MSDQDFFFDEEDEAVSEAPKASSKSGGKAQAPARQAAPRQRSAAAPSAAPAGEKQVSRTVAALMAVGALLLGVIIGFVLPGGSTGATPSTGAAAGTGSTTAPGPLTEDQLSSGQLPEGHPPIESMGATGAAETTSSGQ